MDPPGAIGATGRGAIGIILSTYYVPVTYVPLQPCHLLSSLELKGPIGYKRENVCSHGSGATHHLAVVRVSPTFIKHPSHAGRLPSHPTCPAEPCEAGAVVILSVQMVHSTPASGTASQLPGGSRVEDVEAKLGR